VEVAQAREAVRWMLATCCLRMLGGAVMGVGARAMSGPTVGPARVVGLGSAGRVSRLPLPRAQRQRQRHSQSGAAARRSPVVAAYEGVVFDMDGTLTVSNIDFADMRERTGIREGDLFTVMERMNDAQHATAMRVILELESKAAAAGNLELQPGVAQLLEMLDARGTALGLVTRNTPGAVEAFFELLEKENGVDWRPKFRDIITRHDVHVKPDWRLLRGVSERWGIGPEKLLMVGDSAEDVEVGLAAGTGTCLISGGGNEVAGGAAGPQADYVVSSLGALQDILENLEADGLGTKDRLPFIAFVDRLMSEEGAVVRGAAQSYPKLAAAIHGSEMDVSGHRVLQLSTDDGAHAKLLFSQGLNVHAVCLDGARTGLARKRGLLAIEHADVLEETSDLKGAFDAAVLHDRGGEGWKYIDDAGLRAIHAHLVPGGRLALDVPHMEDGEAGPGEALEELSRAVDRAGFVVDEVAFLHPTDDATKAAEAYYLHATKLVEGDTKVGEPSVGLNAWNDSLQRGTR